MYTLKDISVVIPSYNNLEYLKLIYNSVRKISNDIEVILFDDGSDDGSDVSAAVSVFSTATATTT